METTTEKTRLARLLSGSEFYHGKDPMQRHYRIRHKTFHLQVERRDSAGEWVFDGFAIPDPREPERLLVNSTLAGAYVETKLDLNQVHILDDHE